MRRSTLRVLYLSLVLMSAMLLVACGSSESDDTNADTVAAQPTSSEVTSNDASVRPGNGDFSIAPGDVSSSVASMAMVRLQEVDTLRFAMVFAMRGLPGTSGDIELSMDGAIDQASGDYAMSIDFGAFMEALAAAEGQSPEEAALVASMFGDGVIEMRQVDDTAYMRWPAISALFGANTNWVSFPSEDAVGSFDASGIVGSDELVDAIEMIGSVTNTGSEPLHGVHTTRYDAEIDYERALSTLNEGAPIPFDSAQLAAVSEWTVPFSIWIDDDGLIRRFSMDFDFASLGLSASDLADAPESMSLVFDIIEVGSDVVVLPPAASDVTDMSSFGGGQFLGELF